MNAETLLFIVKRYEEKLKTLMPEDEYYEFTSQTAKDAFRDEIDRMADGSFKNFCKANLDLIFGKE